MTESKHIENIVIAKPWPYKDMAKALFSTVDGETQPYHLSKAKTLEELMVEVGVYKSLSDARRAGREGEIPEGFTFEYKASKTRRLWIWNPKKAA